MVGGVGGGGGGGVGGRATGVVRPDLNSNKVGEDRYLRR